MTVSGKCDDAVCIGTVTLSLHTNVWLLPFCRSLRSAVLARESLQLTLPATVALMCYAELCCCRTLGQRRIYARAGQAMSHQRHCPALHLPPPEQVFKIRRTASLRSPFQVPLLTASSCAECDSIRRHPSWKSGPQSIVSTAVLYLLAGSPSMIWSGNICNWWEVLLLE